MLDEEEELIAPDVPIKANPAIPVAIGIMLILGSLVAALLSFGSAAFYFVDDQMRDDAGFTDEQNRTFDIMVETGIAGTFAIMYGLMALGLMIAGIMLMRKNPFGVKLGIASASIFMISNIVETIWMYLIADDYGFEASIGSGSIIKIGCSAFCIALPLLAVLIPEGKAALYREPVVLSLSEEE